MSYTAKTRLLGAASIVLAGLGVLVGLRDRAVIGVYQASVLAAAASFGVLALILPRLFADRIRTAEAARREERERRTATRKPRSTFRDDLTIPPSSGPF